MTFTLVSLHAHPDDETLLTGGTLARASADGHRVVLVTATDGAAGLTSSTRAAAGRQLARVRSHELSAAAAILGVHSVVDLGFGDSGTDGRTRGPRVSFADAPLDAAAERLAAILAAEQADALTIYDRYGGYGHPDHVRVHEVGHRAAALARTPVVLEATVDRARIQRALRLIGWLPRLPANFDAAAFANRYLPNADLTHQIDVRDHLSAKRAAMAAHASQREADGEARSLRLFLRLPPRLFRAVFGYEWFREHDRAPATPKLDDVFATLRR